MTKGKSSEHHREKSLGFSQRMIAMIMGNLIAITPAIKRRDNRVRGNR